ncbi:MAG: hypothetical protein ABSA70_04990 [Terriglobia bacterium]
MAAGGTKAPRVEMQPDMEAIEGQKGMSCVGRREFAIARCLLFTLLLSCCVPGDAAATAPGNPASARQIRLVFDQVPTEDAAFRLAVEDLQRAVEARGFRVLFSGQCEVNAPCVVVKGRGKFQNDREVANQGFTIEPIRNGLQLSSSGIGLVYGAFRLAEAIRRDGVDWNLRRSETPAFGERIFSYQGTVFGLPDEGYYFRHPPYVNAPLLEQQVEAAKTAMRRLLPYGINTVAFLNLNVEDYINYDLWGNGNAVYSPDSLHRTRSAIFCRALSELADYAHQLHMQFFLQIYEFSLPDHLDGRQLSDGSQRTWELVDAKFGELFQRASLDGIILTLTEPSPRMAYRGITLWQTPEGAGRMASHYYDTVVKKVGRRLIVRLWWVTDDPQGFKRLLTETPDPGIMYDTKNTNGDFFLSVGENPLISQGSTRTRPFSVTFDTFRQFDGWGTLVLYPTFWADRFKHARENGVVAVNAWGPWFPGCIFPGTWVGKYDEYDFLRHGFRPALASLYLFSRLAWNPTDSPEAIARDWAALHFGKENAEALRKVLCLSYDLWKTTYLGEDDRGTFKWTMVFQPVDPSTAEFFKNHHLEELQLSNRRALTLAAKIHALIYSMDTRKAPDPEAIREFRRAADLTLLYFRTFALWRELLWRNHAMAERRDAAGEAALRRVAAELAMLLPEWRKYPGEAKDWFVFRFDPEMNTAPSWLKRTSVAEIVREIQSGLRGKN